MLLTILLFSQVAHAECNFEAFSREQNVRRDKLISEARALLSEARSISEKRIAIAERLSEIAAASPLKQLKGVADPNWNSSALRGQDEMLKHRQSLIAQRTSLISAESKLLDSDREAFNSKCGNTPSDAQY